MTRPNTGIAAVKDLKGRRVAVTRGTDPHIFLIRALRGAGLPERDVKLVLLQHPDGRTALDRGDVDAWAGLDPIMAAAEIENGDVLFHRDAAANTWGVLNVREDFAKQNPDLTRTVLGRLRGGAQARPLGPAGAQAHPGAATKLPEPVVARQLERTDLSQPVIGKLQAETILDAGTALLDAGVIPAGTDVGAAVQALIDPRFGPAAPVRAMEASPLPLVAPAPAVRRPVRLTGGRMLVGLVLPSASPSAGRRRCGGAGAGAAGAAAEPGAGHAVGPRRERRTLDHVLASLTRVAAGFGFGALAGILVGRAHRHLPLVRRLSTRASRRSGRFPRSPGCRCSSCGSASSRPRRSR